MSHFVKADINPDCLKWAREEAGYEVAEISEELNIDPNNYAQWEITGEKVPLGKLKDLSNKYKKQLAAFFLPKAPEKSTSPKDFRNLALRGHKLSKEIVLAFRRTDRYREIAREIEGEEYWDERYSWRQEVNHITRENLLTEDVFSWLRILLNVPIENQVKIKNHFDAYKLWRNCIEAKLGIFVFQFPMPMSQVQGFSYRDFAPYAIVVNNKHSYAGRIFTLFHELAHILLKDAGMCNPDISEDSQQSIEFLCNEFAGKFLVPDNAVVPAMDLKELQSYSNTYKVSKEVYLRRMFAENYLTKSDFFKELKKIKDLQPLAKKKTTDGGPNRLVVNRSYRGELFFNMVLDAAHQNKISFNTASDVLGIGTNYLMKG